MVKGKRMKIRWVLVFGLISTSIIGSVDFRAESSASDGTETESEHRTQAHAEGEAGNSTGKRVSVEVARDRARMLHEVYASTLDVMHNRYFHGERAIVPARAMEDVFSQIQTVSKIEARWFAVNLKPMSVAHEARTPFEKTAASQLASGKTDVEIVEDGYYRRAVSIPLGSGCISCHGGFLMKPSSQPKFAGLVISIPIQSDTKRMRSKE